MTLLSRLTSKPLLAVLVLLVVPSASAGQWLTLRSADVPRTPNGEPDLSAPAPRTPDGKPDLSGIWTATTKLDSDFARTDAPPWAQEQARRREENPASDSWATLCLPPGPMINFTGPLKFVQTPRAITVLHEVSNNFRQIFMDGRELPQDPNPTWQGYSIGRWDDDTLVVDTIGFNDKSLVGRPAYPHSEALHVTERYRRRDFGHIDLQMTIDDPKVFSRPFTIRAELVIDAKTELLEFVCNENEKSRQHFVQPTAATVSEFRVDPAVLAKYVGTYEMMTPRGPSKATMSLQGDQLMVDVPGFGSGRMMPQSATMFMFRGAIVEFIPNDNGDVTHLIVHAVEGAFKGLRITEPSK